MDSRDPPIASNTSIIVNGGKEGYQKWTGDKWEHVYLAAGTAERQAEADHLEDGLPMKVMRFMGLPKSYRHTLYNEFVQDVTQIPADTATSFYNIVSWVCGKNEGEGNDSPKSGKTSGEGDARVDDLKIISTSSTESMGSPAGNSEVIRTDSASNLKIITPFGVLVDSESTAGQPVQVLEAVTETELPNGSVVKGDPSTHGIVLGVVKKESQMSPAHILELDPNGKVIRIPSRQACYSETSIYGYGMSETESEGGFVSGSIPATPMLSQSEKEEVDDGEEVKRVTFAPSSETNIYAYQDYEGDETGEESHTDIGSKKTDSDTQVEESKENVTTQEPVSSNVDQESETCQYDPNVEQCDEKPEEDIQNDKIESSIPPATTVDTLDRTAEEVDVEKVTESAEITKPLSEATVSNPRMKKLSSTTSEIQLQLNNDLKTLEDIVKKLYKNLNKKGPVTIVANFKPKEDGELALDMGSLTGKPKLKVASAEKSAEKSAVQPEEPKLRKEKIIAPEQPTKKAGEKHGPATVHESRESAPLPKPTRPLNSAETSRLPSVSIMKNSPAKPNTPIQHASPVVLQARKSCLNVSKLPHPTLQLQHPKDKIDADKNNNIVNIETPPQLKPALKQSVRMPSLRPASSSHSVTRTSIVTANKVDVETRPVIKSSSSKHYILKTPSSHHLFVEQSAPQQQQQHYKIVEASNSQCYLVPVTSQQNHLVVSGASRSASQHNILVEAPTSQHLLVESPTSNAKHFLMQAPGSQHHFYLEDPHPQQVIVESQPPPFQHILVETPPPATCQNPHLHPRTATILPPATSSQFHKPATGTSSPQLERGGSYRLIQPCSMHTHTKHSQYHHHQPKRGGRYQQHDESAVEDSASNASMVSSVSSTFSGVDAGDGTAASEGETVEEVPVRITTTAQSSTHCQRRFSENRLYTSKSKPPVNLQARKKQSTEKLIASPSATKQYRTTIHIPTGPPKHNSYRAIFKERQQQQNQQTVYVDLTSKGLRKNR